MILAALVTASQTDAGELPTWDAWATLAAAVIAAVLASLSLLATRRASAREAALQRFETALTRIDTGKRLNIEFGVTLLGTLADSTWLSPEDQSLAASTLAAYNRSRSVAGGAP